jgi:hypothetical protein
MRIAAVTMAYNEPDYVPIWVRHYARQIGAAHCYLVDHGSDDGSTRDLGPVSVLRLPRSPQDDPRRARFLSDLCAGLLEWYDAVVHTDVDELLLADPAAFPDLAAFAAATTAPAVTAIGLNVQQVPALEPAYDPARPLGAQRRWVQFCSALCKPALIRRRVAWEPGFHCADAPVAFGDLYLFHLRWYDRDRGLSRLAKTRAMPWAIEGAGSHQRMPDADFAAMFDGIAALPRRDAVPFSPLHGPVAEWLDRLRATMAGREQETYRYDLHLTPPELWEIPSRFRAALIA